MAWLYPDPKKPCLCDHAYSNLGKLNGMNMGKGWVRTTTHPACYHHSKCHGYTAAYRNTQPQWSNPYCPIHGTKDCPNA